MEPASEPRACPEAPSRRPHTEVLRGGLEQEIQQPPLDRLELATDVLHAKAPPPSSCTAVAPVRQPRAPTQRIRLRGAGAVRAPARRAWTRGRSAPFAGVRPGAATVLQSQPLTFVVDLISGEGRPGSRRGDRARVMPYFAISSVCSELMAGHDSSRSTDVMSRSPIQKIWTGNPWLLSVISPRRFGTGTQVRDTRELGGTARSARRPDTLVEATSLSSLAVCLQLPRWSSRRFAR
jgi:hypothetical protein